MFTEMVTKPQFDIERITAETGVVDQEFKDNLQNDDSRLNQVFRTTGNINHSYTNYFGGNSDTLKHIKAEKELLDFYRSHYSSHRMRLVVIGTGTHTSFTNIQPLSANKSKPLFLCLANLNERLLRTWKKATLS
ncbi:metalloprotease [Entomophthora muscae]|uniref:Metalloprotease n=1 Tax=Entomophthora muscae TaxID=34485 RepID=A0ACC2T440_9FUNG|nr:metalloprotease [Entomophthora muscae]